jgi:methyl coenzyme M reductase alpha subunit
MVNTLLKYKGLAFFGTYENARGRTITEVSQRQATQYAADLIYRFPANRENFWVGCRYNTVTAALQGYTSNITVQREAASAGWFLTRNIMLKAEYVNQVYMGYPANNILNGGKFYGTVMEASIAF